MRMVVILVAMAVLLLLTIRKVPVSIAALITVFVLAVGSGMELLPTIMEDYMGGVASFIKSTWLMILLGTILSKLMDVTGAAASIAQYIIQRLGTKRAILAVIVASGLLTYGGIASFVACYTVYPIALVIFRKANLPRYLIPAAIAGGIYTWVTMLPGNPSLVNMAAVTYLNTTPTAAPFLGTVTAAFTLICTILYLQHEARRARKCGDSFEPDENTAGVLEKVDTMERNGKIPNPLLALLPVLCVVVVLNLLQTDIAVALLAGIFLCGGLFVRSVDECKELLEKAAQEAAHTALVAASIVGIGSVIRISPGFTDITEWVRAFGASEKSPLIIYAVTVAVMSGMLASAFSGLSTVLSAMSELFLGMGIAPELLHRVGVIAAVGLGGLPHSGGIVAVLSVSGVSYREGYKHLFVVMVVIPTLALAAVLILSKLL